MMITLENLIDGEKLQTRILGELANQGLSLSEKHAGLNSAPMPKIKSLLNETHLELDVEYNGQTYFVRLPKANDAILRAGLCFMYGNGLVRHDYSLPIFTALDAHLLKKHAELAVEIWERNVHLDWMKSKGYKTHNGTKDNIFLQGIILDWPAKQDAIKVHNERSARGEEGDTPHHVFSDVSLLRKIMEREGNHELSRHFIESIYDQATATARMWYPKREDKPFEKRLAENRDEGYYIRKREDGKIERWKPGVFEFTNAYETKIWQIWCKAHEEFKEYWTAKFGKTEELWQPPAPMNIIKAK